MGRRVGGTSHPILPFLFVGVTLIMQFFDPVSLSKAENRFLLQHVGKPPVVALSEVVHPVNPRAVKPVLDRVYELLELEKHRGEKWVGVEAIKAAISRWLEMDEKWSKEAKRGRPRFPSLFSFDGRGRGHRYGPGSDSGWVRTYFDEKGKRQTFAIALTESAEVKADEVFAPEYAGADMPTDGIKVDPDNRRIECLVCGHTESFNPESRASYNAARARISKHLRKATIEPDRHREVHTAEFGA